MINYDEMVKRSTLQYLANHVRELNVINLTEGSFAEREEKANEKLDAVINGLKDKLSDEEILTLESRLNDCMNDIMDVYFSMGMKIGARLVSQLLSETEKDY